MEVQGQDVADGGESVVGELEAGEELEKEGRKLQRQQHQELLLRLLLFFFFWLKQSFIKYLCENLENDSEDGMCDLHLGVGDVGVEGEGEEGAAVQGGQEEPDGTWDGGGQFHKAGN